MGHLCRIQERWKEADERYRVALKRRPHDPTLHYNIGLVNEKMDRLEVTDIVDLYHVICVMCGPIVLLVFKLICQAVVSHDVCYV